MALNDERTGVIKDILVVGYHEDGGIFINHNDEMSSADLNLLMDRVKRFFIENGD